MRTTLARRGAVVSVLALLVLAGCGAAGSEPGPPSTSPTPTATVSRPADGVSLSALGFENGPVDRVFVPVGAQLATRVDQTNNVTLVLTAPSAAALTDFYRRTATGNGFVVTADDPATTTLTFSGFGWTGTFTGDARASALLLRPAS
ncbi:hypothetical protein [Microlunatus antarcticus]|uniref:Lipoprotein n=1 Tax=Microlunatus antarcticus TaxID=53388 RepID=A0A7W5P5V4_9ACTN|nr:hypothetical protein [Microlunatus antarcticus]MBB3325702.1 hypothetical protein [Microlunatus antarcticus]